jgi:hypothetical protein
MLGWAGRVGETEDFRARAAERDKAADEAKDPQAKRMLQDAANNWRTWPTKPSV